MDALINIGAFGVLLALWLAFGATLVLDRALLDRAWHTFRRWPILVQCIMVLLTLPVVVGLWVWETRWPTFLRLALVVALAWMTIYTFFPRFA